MPFDHMLPFSHASFFKARHIAENREYPVTLSAPQSKQAGEDSIKNRHNKALQHHASSKDGENS
ncbi:MAG: hypothetical protein B7Y58_05935 [Halothiobacillus sp. 35-54-62]|nr:MAG: hypothetical protein B7Y58_05935 [Halothiobacillus sp. 35-54-62]